MIVLSLIAQRPDCAALQDAKAASPRPDEQRKALVQSETLRSLGQLANGRAHDLNSRHVVVSYSDLPRQALRQRPPNIADVEDLLTTTAPAGRWWRGG